MIAFDVHFAAKAIGIAIGLAIFLCGLRAVGIARRATQVQPEPAFTCELGDSRLTAMQWNAANAAAIVKSGELNSRALPWMQASLWLGLASAAVATVFG